MRSDDVLPARGALDGTNGYRRNRDGRRPERLEMPRGEPGQQRVRLQVADGIGLMVRQRPVEARVG